MQRQCCKDHRRELLLELLPLLGRYIGKDGHVLAKMCARLPTLLFSLLTPHLPIWSGSCCHTSSASAAPTRATLDPSASACARCTTWRRSPAASENPLGRARSRKKRCSDALLTAFSLPLDAAVACTVGAHAVPYCRSQTSSRSGAPWPTSSLWRQHHILCPRRRRPCIRAWRLGSSCSRLCIKACFLSSIKWLESNHRLNRQVLWGKNRLGD